MLQDIKYCKKNDDVGHFNSVKGENLINPLFFLTDNVDLAVTKAELYIKIGFGKILQELTLNAL